MFDLIEKMLATLRGLQLEDLQSFEWMPLLLVLLISCASSIALSLLYLTFFERRATGSDIHRAFPALGTAITGIFVCLQFSLPLSLGLLGALSIVRFRTPIKEPEEIGFLMLLIASSICCATLNFTLLALLLGLMTLMLTGMRLLPWAFGRRTALASIVLSAPSDNLTDAPPLTQTGDVSTVTLTVFRGSADGLTALQRDLQTLIPAGDVSVFIQRPLPL